MGRLLLLLSPFAYAGALFFALPFLLTLFGGTYLESRHALRIVVGAGFSTVLGWWLARAVPRDLAPFSASLCILSSAGLLTLAYLDLADSWLFVTAVLFCCATMFAVQTFRALFTRQVPSVPNQPLHSDALTRAGERRR